MKRTKYRKRRPGDMEIRILPDGRLVLIAPDEKMLDVARRAAQQGNDTSREVKEDGKGR